MHCRCLRKFDVLGLATPAMQFDSSASDQEKKHEHDFEMFAIPNGHGARVVRNDRTVNVMHRTSLWFVGTDATWRLLRIIPALLLLPLTGCLPVRSTYYEAVDLPWSVPHAEETAAKCPQRDYGPKALETEEVWVRPDLMDRSKIRMNISVKRGQSSAFQLWTVRLISLSDAGQTTSLHPRFYNQCSNVDADSCPPISSALADGGNYIGVVDIPKEFVNRFALELHEPEGKHTFDWSTQRFSVKTSVVARGTFGCY